MLHQNLGGLRGTSFCARGKGWVSSLPLGRAQPCVDGSGWDTVWDPSWTLPPPGSWLERGQHGGWADTWGAPETLHFSSFLLSPWQRSVPPWASAELLCIFPHPWFLNLCLPVSLSLVVPLIHPQRMRGGRGLESQKYPSPAARSSMGPRRLLGSLTPRTGTFSCGPVLPAVDTCTPHRTEKEVLEPGDMGLGLTSVLSQLGGLGKIVHLATLTFPFCQIGRQLQPL